MVNRTELLNAMVDTLRAIPELIALLEDGANSITAYVDQKPTKTSAGKAVYQMGDGTILCSWSGSTLERSGETMLGWVHTIDIFARAKRGGSALEILDALANGYPNPGDGQRWDRCPLISGVLPTSIISQDRVIDEEGIDYFVTKTVTQETGD